MASDTRADDLRDRIAAQHLHAIIEASPIPLVITRANGGEILFANQELASLVGLSLDQLIGRVSPDFYRDQADRQRLLTMLREDGVAQGMELQIVRSDGTPLWVSFTMVTSAIDGEGVIIGGLYNIDDRKHAEQALQEAMSKLEKAHAEREASRAQLVQSEKMAALGSMVAGIAHEINTPIGAINSTKDTLALATKKLRANLDKAFPEHVEDRRIKSALAALEDAYRVIESAATRVAQIVRRLRSFARLDEAQLKKANLHEGIEDTLVLTHHQTKNRIEIVKRFGADVPEINCFPGQLNQVFLNMIVNASQAIDGKGTITIETALVPGTSSAGSSSERVHVRISDTGSGIAPDKLERIFDPGFTTKGVGVGTGLGLSICYQIVHDAHKGEIFVHSELGVGTTFTIAIPTDLKEPAFVPREQAEQTERNE
ncbi:MAG: PAS domain S-box protein [Myxococcales bacterium]|nr:PAS domain S-box protein [Myxococcales bacterium]